MDMKNEAGLGLAVHWVQLPLSQLMRIIVLLDLLRQVGNL